MLFDYLFIVSLLLEWTTILFLFLVRNQLWNSKHRANLASNLSSTLFSLVILFKILHVSLFIFNFDQKGLEANLLLPTTIYVLWQLILSALFFYLLMKFSFRHHFQERFAIALSKRTFAELVFISVWDLTGSLLIYLMLTSKFWLNQFHPVSISVPFNKPILQFPLLVMGVALLTVSFFSFFKLKKEVTRFSFLFYSSSYLALIFFSFFTFYQYRKLIFPGLESFFNQYYLFLAVLFWLIIFLVSVIVFGLMVQLHKNKKFLKSGFQFRFLFYNLSRLHLLSETGMTLFALLIVFFFIYF